MNYLAHFQLSGSIDGLLVGALLGDFVKGSLDRGAPQSLPLIDKLPAHTIEGIKLHRYIDGFFDRQHVILNFPENPASDGIAFSAVRHRRYLPIVLDLLFDLFLTRHWHKYSSEPLEAYSDQVIETLCNYQALLPAQARKLLLRLEQHQLLNRYDDMELLEEICGSIANRLPEGNTLLQVFKEACAQQEELEKYFLQTYPAVIKFSEDSKRSLNVIMPGSGSPDPDTLSIAD